MCKIVRIVAIGLLMALYSIPGASAAWLWGDANTVVTINDEAFSPDDFKHWWALWNEEKNAVPEDPQQFIEWKLVAQEARIMELDQTPTFKRKINVFLKSRSRVQFKYDEVDSRIQPMSEQELKDTLQGADLVRMAGPQAGHRSSPGGGGWPALSQL